MKKFKITAEKRDIEDLQLKAILSDKNLLHNVLLRYVHLPLGLLVAALSLLAIQFAYGSVLIPETVLFCFQSIAGVAFFYSYKNYRSFQEHRHQLHDVINGFVGLGVFPVMFLMLFLYVALPLGMLDISLSLAFVFLTVVHHLKVSRQSQHGPMDALAYSLCLTILVSLPLFGPNAVLAWPGALVMAISGVGFAALAMIFKKELYLKDNTLHA